MQASQRLGTERHLAWHGPAVLVTDGRGACGDGASLTGWYVREARHLSRLALELDGARPWTTAVGQPRQDELVVAFVHPELREMSGGGSGIAGAEVPRDARGLPVRSIDVLVRCRLRFARLEVETVITNRHAHESLALDLAWCLDADFADLPDAQGEAAARWTEIDAVPGESTLHFRARSDALPLETLVSASGSGGDGVPVRWRAARDRLAARLVLAPQRPLTLRLVVDAVDPAGAPLDAARQEAREAAVRAWRAGLARLETPHAVLGPALRQALDDLGSLALLEGEADEWLAPAAGMPLYPALFGRDALTVGWQAAMFDRGRLLECALARLGRLQGRRVDPSRDEEPGRIVQQVRQGPGARLGRNPFDRYYADFASPLMFVIALAQQYGWTGERALLDRHWDTVQRILDWARERGDLDGDGYLEYLTRAAAGPRNQGWKDSGDAIVDEAGRAVDVPCATCELQGYWFAAQQLAAVLCAARGRLGEARALRAASQELKARFNRDWWLPEERCVALAMGPDKRPVRVATSNAGHCIASGIVADEHLPPLVGRLFAPDLFSGWGIRTLSTAHPAYNPQSYHLGSVWTVESATTAFGLRRFGFDQRALELVEATFALAALHDRWRVPECVGGFARGDWGVPGAYPRANQPQAWNQSALALLVQTMLGLQPVAPLDTLVVDPVLPDWLPEVVVHDLRVGGATATLRCWRDAGGRSHAELLKKRGTLHLVRQQPPESLSATVGDRFRALFDGVLHG